MRFYFDFGLRITINTDNRLMTDTTVTDELMLIHRKLGFTLPQIARIVLTGFKSAFIPFRQRRALYDEAKAEIMELTGLSL